MDALRVMTRTARYQAQRLIPRFLVSLSVVLMVLVATACGGGQATPTQKPADKPAAATAAPPSQPAPAAAAATTAPAGQPKATTGEVLIGMNVGLTGAFAAEGDYYMKAMRLAEKQINQAGGVNGKSIKVLPLDNQSTNPGALAALSRSVEQDKVLALIGPVKSTQILAMSDAVKGYGIPTMIGGTNASITKVGNPWFFRCRVSDTIIAEAIVKYIKDDLKLTKIGIIHSNEAFGSGGADAVEQYAKTQGLTIVRREKFTVGDRDFTAQLLSIKNAGAEVLVPYSGGSEEVAVINRQYRQLGSPYKYMGTPAVAMKDVLQLSRDATEGLVGVIEAVPGQSESNTKYIAEYKKEYNNADPDIIAMWTYDGLKILADAIKKGGENRDKIRDAILATKGYDGAIGTFNFTSEGEGLHQASVVQITNGDPKLVKRVDVDK